MSCGASRQVLRAVLICVLHTVAPRRQVRPGHAGRPRREGPRHAGRARSARLAVGRWASGRRTALLVRPDGYAVWAAGAVDPAAVEAALVVHVG
ncbi:hypothetical protein ACUXZZ_28175 [Streptomyces graminifolii]|uniref:hypothetical protein n=1 Tax=Streptomyces graminifolii TaxID=1266771 RepID=UPI004058C606